MDHSIKKKPEKPRLAKFPNGKAWACRCRAVLAIQPTGTGAYQEWKRIRNEYDQTWGK